MFQIAVVGEARLWGEVQSHFQILVLDLQCLCESSQGTQPSLRHVSGLCMLGEFDERDAQFRRQKGR